MTLDTTTRRLIAKAIEQGISAKMETYNEKWITEVELCKELPSFTLSWLKEYGQKVPRERVNVCRNGVMIPTKKWMYPLHKIKRMLAEGNFRAIIVKDQPKNN